jgi:ribosomal protein L21
MASLRLEMDKVLERAKKLAEIERNVEAEQMALKFRYEVIEIQADYVEKTKVEMEVVEERHRVFPYIFNIRSC